MPDTFDKNNFDFMFVTDPESIFNRPSLLHTSREVNQVIDRFDRAKEKKPYHGAIMDLLKATSDFLAASDPLNEMRQLTYSDQDTQNVFTDMQMMLMKARELHANLSEENPDVFGMVLNYCQTCVRKRALEFGDDPALLANWNRSDLKKMLEE